MAKSFSFKELLHKVLEDGFRLEKEYTLSKMNDSEVEEALSPLLAVMLVLDEYQPDISPNTMLSFSDNVIDSEGEVNWKEVANQIIQALDEEANKQSPQNKQRREQNRLNFPKF